ncbi:MAG: serine protease [Ktedonobacteraceae bacterium]
MSLLTEDEHDQLIDLLCKLPHGMEPDLRQQLLMGLPHSLRVQIPNQNVPKIHFTSMVDLTDEYSAEPYEGVWPVIQLLKRAVVFVTPQSPLGTKLQDLLNIIQTKAHHWEVWSNALAELPPQNSEYLEQIVDATMGLHDPVDWRGRMHQGERATCLILFQGHSPEPQGTGFLVGPDLLMTNYHVIEPVLRQHVGFEEVVLWFDFKTFHNTPIGSPRPYRLSHTYLFDKSPTNNLDYVLLRVQGTPGLDATNDAPKRGWLVPMKHTFLVGEPLFIIQHPQGGPLKFAFDRVQSANESHVYYRTNTDNGSSGSPCFTLTWDLVALHQGSGPDAGSAKVNKGIAFSRILDQPGVQAAFSS